MRVHPRIKVYSGREQLAFGLLNHVADCAADATRARGRFCVALSGGSTLDLLVLGVESETVRDRVDWSKWHVFFADERWVARDSPESNYGAAKRRLFDKVDIPGGQIHAPDVSLAPDEAAADYETVIARALGSDKKRPPRFDLVLLGVGEDGHTASLFPGGPALQETRRWAVPVFDAPKPPPVRITLTLPVLNRARNIVFAVTGTRKARIISRIFRSRENGPDLPALMVKPRDGGVWWFLDREAASGLSNPVGEDELPG